MTTEDRIEKLDEELRQARRSHAGLLEITEELYETAQPYRDYPDGGEETLIAGEVVETVSEAARQLRLAREALERLMLEKELRLEPLLQAARERGLRESRERELEYRKMTAGRF
jgi:hypothetical protein